MIIAPHTQIITLLLASVLSTSAMADDDAGVTPYRPSVSSPAQLPSPGQLEFELGGLHAKSGDERRDSLPYLFKLAFNEQWGLLIGGEGHVRMRDDVGGSANGIGDTSVMLKRAFLVSDISAFGLEFGVKVPTAKDSIGSGKSDYTLNTIFSHDIDQLHVDMNLNATRLGASDIGTSNTQTGASISFSFPLADKWGANAEISGMHRNGTSNTSQLLAAVTYSPSKRLVFDFGLTKGLNNNTSPNLAIFGGVVMPIARLW
jgi:hypothetical protein